MACVFLLGQVLTGQVLVWPRCYWLLGVVWTGSPLYLVASVCFIFLSSKSSVAVAKNKSCVCHPLWFGKILFCVSMSECSLCWLGNCSSLYLLLSLESSTVSNLSCLLPQVLLSHSHCSTWCRDDLLCSDSWAKEWHRFVHVSSPVGLNTNCYWTTVRSSLTMNERSSTHTGMPEHRLYHLLIVSSVAFSFSFSKGIALSNWFALSALLCSLCFLFLLLPSDLVSFRLPFIADMSIDANTPLRLLLMLDDFRLIFVNAVVAL